MHQPQGQRGGRKARAGSSDPGTSAAGRPDEPQPPAQTPNARRGARFRGVAETWLVTCRAGRRPEVAWVDGLPGEGLLEGGQEDRGLASSGQRRGEAALVRRWSQMLLRGMGPGSTGPRSLFWKVR